MASEAQIVHNILKQNEFMLMRHLVLSKTVLDQMKASGVITETTMRKITGVPTHEQVAILLKSLEPKGLASLRKFLEVLRGTGHSWIVDSLLDTDVMATTSQNTDSSRRVRYNLKPDPRKGPPIGHPDLPGPLDHSLSLDALLKTREPADPAITPRGMFNTRSLLTDSIPDGAPYNNQFQAPPLQQSHYNNLLVTHPMSKEDIPLALYGLNQAFSDQDQRNQQALSVLQQEEIAIRQLMEQNVRDQSNVRRKQAAVQDIAVRLRDIHHRATEVYGPTPHPNIGRYRLTQLNKIPWSIDG